jgi:hypothetical protein
MEKAHLARSSNFGLKECPFFLVGEEASCWINQISFGLRTFTSSICITIKAKNCKNEHDPCCKSEKRMDRQTFGRAMDVMEKEVASLRKAVKIGKSF